MPRIGLTGGIGAGKSAVAEILVSLGAVLIDADHVAREVVEVGTPGLSAVVERFGKAVLLPDGGLDRPALGRIVFGDDQARADLNAILHPLVGLRMQALVAELRPEDVQVHDIPLLVENGLVAGFDAVIVVQAPLETRLQRLTAHRPMTRQDALNVIAAQASDEQRAAVATYVINNDGSLDELRTQVTALWPHLCVNR